MNAVAWGLTLLLVFGGFISRVLAADAVKGKDLYQKCIACHGSDGMGKKSQQAPMIAGQYDWYIVKQLQAIKTKQRDNSNAQKMYPFVKNLSDQDVENIALYIQSLPKK